MTNFNHARYLARAIQAAVEQSRPPDEFIIFDDASTDDSAHVIEQFARRCKCITFRKNEHNMGAVRSVMRARELATGDYIYGAAADDKVCPGFFEKAMDMAQRYASAGAIMGQMVAIDPDGLELWVDKVDAWQKSHFVSPSAFLGEYLEHHIGLTLGAATIYKATALAEVGGFRPELGPWCDGFAARAIALKHGVCYIADRCACYTSHPGSFSRKLGREPRYMFDITERGANLMRSAEFRNIFPEEHVARWERQRRQYYANCHVGRFQDLIDEALALTMSGFSMGTGLDRLVGRLLGWWIGVERRVMGRCLRSAIGRYRPQSDNHKQG